MIALTGGTLLWAVVEDESNACSPGASECYRGLLTLGAIVGAAAGWAAAYGLGVVARRLMQPRLRPPQPRE